MAALNPYLRLVWENVIFLTFAVSFFAIAGYAWRNSKPFEIPKPLPSWFQTWLSQAYVYEMTDEQHRELAQVLHSVKGKVAISGYQCFLMNELYGDWKTIIAPTKTCHSTKGLRTEILWINYEINDISKQSLNNANNQKVESECQPQQQPAISILNNIIFRVAGHKHHPLHYPTQYLAKLC